MTDERWRRIEQLYHDALETPVADRDTFLGQACGKDAALRHEVESLLDLQPATDDFLERPAIESAARSLADVLPALRPPEIPGYRILRELGEGGMGLVYLAEQETPLRRLVALKLIKPGMDSRQVVARFNAERQALALMDHPNIAAVYDAGVTVDGRPYFVMEFVDGPPIVAYCDRKRLSTRARLGLFTEVCAAVQHAHQKGVIHRDLKPSNVLVAEQDCRVVPKVIDFGTAKAIERTWEGAITLTAQGMVLGTIEYMSPEQAAFSGDIDTTTDVYSLGVMLYELLVGVLPFERPRPGPEGYDEMRRLIRDSDPPKPSARLLTVTHTPTGIAAARETHPDRLSRSLKGDLDWITLKALDKDRTRRYPTVVAFATDVQRFLSDEPIEARPPSAVYRIRKFTRRHRGSVAAATAMIVVLVSGLVASIAMYVRAERAGAEANRARTAAETQRALAESARTTAEHATAEAGAQRQAAIDANETTRRQSLLTAQEAQRAVAALRESEYRNYVITIGAADGEIRNNRPAVARERLLIVPDARRAWEWHHLFLRTDTSLFTFADTSPCGTPQFSIDRLVATEDAKRIFLSHCQHLNRWDTPTGERVVATMPDGASLVAASPSGRRLVTSQLPTSWQLGLIDQFEGGTMQVLGAIDNQPMCGDFSASGALIAVGIRPTILTNGSLADDEFEVWNVQAGVRVQRLRPPRPAASDTRSHPETTCTVRFSPDGSLIATSGATVRLWDIGTGAERFADPGQAGRVAQPVAFSPDGMRLAVGRRNGLVDVLSLTSGAVAITHLDGGQFIRPLPIPPGADRVSLVGSRSQEETRAVAFSPDGRFLVSGLFNRVAVWDLSARRAINVLDGHKSPISGVVVAPHGVVYSSDLQGTVRAWPIDGAAGITQLDGPSSATARVGVSVSGRTIVASDADGSLVAWRVDERRPVRLKPPNMTGQREMGNVALPSSDGRFVVTTPWTEGETSLARWSLDSGRQLETLPRNLVEAGCGELGRAQWASLSFDDRYLAYGHGGCVVVRDLSTGRTVAKLNLQTPADSGRWVAGDLQFRPDEVLLVMSAHYPRSTGGFDAVSMMIWDWRANRVLVRHNRTDLLDASRIFGPPEWAVSADGRRVALSGFVPYAVSIWDGDLSREISRLPVSSRTAIALSADGQRIATSHNQNDTSVRVWDTATSQLLLTLTDIDPHRGDIAFTPAGRLIAGRVSGGITIWETQKPKCAACPNGR